MTINCQIATVATAFSNLSITGITFKDVSKIPDSGSLICPIIFPQPNGFVTGLSFTTETFGSMGTPKINTNYTLNYVYLHCEAGSGLGAFSVYASIITNLELIIEKLLANDVINGAIDVTPEFGDIGVIEDPAGNKYWGMLFSLKVLEHTQ